MVAMSKVSLATAWLLLAARIVNAALNLDGTQAVQPLEIDDPSPIGDLTTYYPDQHDCPLPCVDYANIHSWISYLSVKRLQRCKEPMLLQLSVTQHLEDPNSHTLIRSCALVERSSDSITSTVNNSSNLQPVENPKKGNDLFQGSLDVAPACSFAGSPVEAELGVIASSGGGNGGNVEDILKGLQKFFETPDNCDESFAFAYHGQTVASVYIGPGLGKSTVSSALEALSKSWEGTGLASNRTVAQLCGSGRDSTQILGVAFDTTGDLAAVQQMAAQWSNGNCVEQADLIPRIDLSIKAFDISGSAATNSSNNNSTGSGRTVVARKVNGQKRNELIKNSENLQKRATCSYIKVVSGDGCPSLVSRCKISAADFTKYNPKSNLCSTLQAGDYVCCSAGDPYTEPKPDPPKQGANGICATHLIQNGDSCDALAKQYGVTVAELEKWNKGKTWAWTECKNMLLGYNMCLSDGRAPLPPPQAGAECGPIVPGTLQPDSTTSIADLNPCPLKACCSNWGFCGVFPAHCDIHKPEGGGPGSKLEGFENTCVSNCGNDIKQNSGAPATFSRVGYYSSFNLERDCLWLSAKNANTDGSYTHIHWAFGEIDSSSWKPVIKESKEGQWKEFKELKNVKRIVSFGGWAASTEAATYNIIRSAIITNRNLFASNLAAFAKEEGIDGIDIDWEYPGAPDILVGGSPIGQKTDGLDYLKFLTVLKQQLGTDRSVSIAAPASYWYLKAFPIDRIAAVIDYIVYMTYDLHGQWDAGNPNAYDQCDSGRCIRSHVNLTETRNSLAIITKAGVPNNKVFVGEASYGRSFHMASDGCWGPMCDFTGSRTQSDANPGRCTKTGGYLSNAELNEIIQRGGATQTFHDGASNSDILLYQGDYVSYMTPTTKETRRSDWKDLNFAGSIDWALDLQAFTTDDMETPPKIPPQGEMGCVAGEDDSVNSGDLCEFSCSLGFCPESLCTCTYTDVVNPLPSTKDATDIIAWDEFDVDLNRLCLFACKHGYCPDDICTKKPKDDVVITDADNPNTGFDYASAREQNSRRCLIYQNGALRDNSVMQCYNTCKPQLDAAAEAGRTSNYGCMGFYPLDKAIPWEKPPGTGYWVAPGQCLCDNWLLNEIADTVIEALPAIAQIGCYILMSSLKLVLDIGLSAIPGVGKALDAGLDMATTAAQMASYLYPEEEDPEGAFSWWLSPCGGTTLVPDDIKRLFGILSSVTGGVSSFKTPKNLPKGSGRKGDGANPHDQGTPRAPSKGNGNNKPKCKIPASQQTQRLRHTLRERACVADKTVQTEWIVTSLNYAANAAPTRVSKPCSVDWDNACWHYSSAIRQNPGWATLTCVPEAAATKKPDMGRRVPRVWEAQHKGKGWWDTASGNRPQLPSPEICQADEYPPLYFLNSQSPAYINAGTTNPGGQLVRMLPGTQNGNAAKGLWKGVCFQELVSESAMSNRDLKNKVDAAGTNLRVTNVVRGDKRYIERSALVDVSLRPEFSVSSWPPSAPNDGLNQNPCWPRNIAPQDPGFTLFENDPYYRTHPSPYNYRADYDPPTNGA